MVGSFPKRRKNYATVVIQTPVKIYLEGKNHQDVYRSLHTFCCEEQEHLNSPAVGKPVW